MGPLITIMVLIDGHILYERLCGLGGKIEKFGLRSGTALALILAAAVLFVRAPEIEGRVYEMRHQYKGPVDYFVPYILEKYEHPEDLVVATNYAEPVSMFYLGSHVTVGFYGTDLDRDLTIQPDIIVPRPWKRNLEALEILAAGVHQRRAIHMAAVIAAKHKGRARQIFAAHHFQWTPHIEEHAAKQLEKLVPHRRDAARGFAQIAVLRLEFRLFQQFLKARHALSPEFRVGLGELVAHNRPRQ